jgi:two-component system OmpR family response regulator
VRILVVDDEPAVRASLARVLDQAGYDVSLASDGRDALHQVALNPPDALVLDVVMPGLDGIEVTRALRSGRDRTPVLLLTARAEVSDRVRGLDAGADDYLTKPFALSELMARLRALTRRSLGARPVELRVGDLCLDTAKHAVSRAGTPVSLSPKEFSLLELFMRQPGQVLSRTHIVDHVWDFAYDGGSNVVDVYVRYLRRKIDVPFGRSDLETVRGVGYRLRRDDGS